MSVNLALKLESDLIEETTEDLEIISIDSAHLYCTPHQNVRPLINSPKIPPLLWPDFSDTLGHLEIPASKSSSVHGNGKFSMLAIGSKSVNLSEL